MKAFLDTHAAVLLAAGDSSEFGFEARSLLERSALFISAFVRLELHFHHEIGRIQLEPGRIIDHLATSVGLRESHDDLARVVGHAVPLQWTRDPFDRLIVATAALHRSPLVTRDRTIRAHFDRAVW